MRYPRGTSGWRAILVAAALLAWPVSQAEAQVEVGASGSLNDIRGGTFGLGGRLAVPVHQGYDATLLVEGVGEIFFPSCASVECDAYGGQVNLIIQRRFGGVYQAYGGIGFAYQDYTLQSDDGTVLEGNDQGVNLVVGSRLGGESRVQPFFELRVSFLDELGNQAGFGVGARIAIGERPQL